MLEDSLLVTKNGDVSFYKKKALHRENGPAIILADGTEEYWVGGKLHRIGGLAVINMSEKEVIYYEGGDLHRIDAPATITPYTIGYYEGGVLHRTDGPAVVVLNPDSDGEYEYEYWINGKRHRDDGPALETKYLISYYWHNLLHRIDGPARIEKNGGSSYYEWGNYLEENSNKK